MTPIPWYNSDAPCEELGPITADLCSNQGPETSLPGTMVYCSDLQSGAIRGRAPERLLGILVDLSTLLTARARVTFLSSTLADLGLDVQKDGRLA
jgi:hypothetical protein